MSSSGTLHFESVIGKTVAGLLALVLSLAVLGAIGASAAQAAVDTGTLIVTKGGDRSLTHNSFSGDPTYAEHLGGAEFQYSTGPAYYGDNDPEDWTWKDIPGSTDNTSGQVSISLPVDTYYVRERGVPTGFDDFGPLKSLTFGGSSSGGGSPQPYIARVKITKGKTTYAYPHDNTSDNPYNWDPTNGASTSNNGSPFLNVRNNGTTVNACGQNILLVLDRSGSIEKHESDYENAAKTFVNSLNGTPTRIGIISFNDSVNSYSPASGNSSLYRAPLDLSTSGNASLLNTTIHNVYTGAENGTNWDGGLKAAAQAKGFGAPSPNPDLVVFITDGNPTLNETSNSGDASNTSLADLSAGIASANLVKNQDSRDGRKVKLLAIGVDTGVTPDNLKVVSGPVQGITGDYATPTIPELQTYLRQLAASQCGALVHVRKKIGDDTNNKDWKFTADEVGGSDPQNLTTANPPADAEALASFPHLPASPATKVYVKENASGQPLPNFTLSGADCRKGSYTGSSVTTTVDPNNPLSYSFDLNRGDDIYCTYTNTPQTPPSLTIEKSPDGGTVPAGQDAVFSIEVTNTGDKTATGVGVTDQHLPTGTAGAWQVTEPASGCSLTGTYPAQQSLTCSNLGDLAKGESVFVKLKAPTSLEHCGVYSNSADATATNVDGTVSDKGDITCQAPHLGVLKTAVSGTINAGDNAEFTIVTSNTGNGTATGVTLNDPLPGPVAGPWTITDQPGEDAGYSEPPCKITGDGDVGYTLECDFGDLPASQPVPPGTVRSVTVSAPTDFKNCEMLDNTATAHATNGSEEGTTGSDSINCQPPDLEVSKTAAKDTINAGDNAEFTIVTTNNEGENTGVAKDVTLTDPLPDGVSGPWTITDQPEGDPCEIVETGDIPEMPESTQQGSTYTLVCDFGNLDPGDSRSVTVSAPTNFDNCSTLDNTAVASGTNTDEATGKASIECQRPSLSVVKNGNGTVNAGEDVVFTIEVANGGPGVARNVTLSDSVPSGVAGAWTISSQPDAEEPPCSLEGGVLSCEFGDLNAEETRSVTISAPTDYEHCTTYDNTATAKAGNSPDMTDSDTVKCEKPEIEITKEGSKRTGTGQDLAFTIEVTNNGQGTAHGVTINDPLSDLAGDWSIVSQSEGADCQLVGGGSDSLRNGGTDQGTRLTCAVGDLKPGQSVMVKFHGTMNNAICRTIDNIATVTYENGPAEGTGSSAANPPVASAEATAATASAEATVPCVKPHLQLRKKANRKVAMPGQKVRYTIMVRNRKLHSVATNLKICDRIPPHMTVTNKGSGHFSNGRLCWKIRRLEGSKKWTKFHYVAKVAEDAAPGKRLKNVVTLEHLRAHWTVRVKHPPVKARRHRHTPVTG